MELMVLFNTGPGTQLRTCIFSFFRVRGILSRRLWPNKISTPMARIILGGKHTTAHMMTMARPSTQITCSRNIGDAGLKLHAKLITTVSSSISHSPRFNKKPANSFFVFLSPTKNAEVPARNTNTGAQKCVIHRVKNTAPFVCCISSGL